MTEEENGNGQKGPVLRAKERVKISGVPLGRRKITFNKGPLTIVGEAFQDDQFITIVTNKGHVRVSIKEVILDDYAD